MTKIGNRVLATNIFLAPLSGISDLAFRLICRQHGAGMCFFEMISSNALVRGHKKTLEILKTNKKDAPIAAQLLGNDSGLMLEAALKLTELANVEFIDINAACPVKKVIKNRQGAYLLREPQILFGILRKLSGNLKVPVTVKMRIGFDRFDEKEIVDIARRIHSNGASVLFVHGRCASEGYKNKVDYLAIRKIKENVGIPVFASGDILSASLAEKMFRETSCDGVLVARGALGNPWIFSEIEKGLSPKISPEEKIRAAKRHLDYIEKYKTASSSAKLGIMKKTALWYSKGFPAAREIRRRISAASSPAGIFEILNLSGLYFPENPSR
ncbi:MAG: tRNA-dihydrouridine synthase [Elusimicrobia bacterium]|nr:tRNA-dihydrouridine synthase [Elusimicrobiota bacterium]